MRTLVIIAVGLILLGMLFGVVRLLAAGNAKACSRAFWAFAVVWAVAAGANMWVGVAHAGYSFAEELPIFLLILLAPLVPGFFVQRHLRRTGRRDGAPSSAD